VLNDLFANFDKLAAVSVPASYVVSLSTVITIRFRCPSRIGKPLSSDQTVGRLLLLRVGTTADQTGPRGVLRGNGIAHDRRDQGRAEQTERKYVCKYIDKTIRANEYIMDLRLTIKLRKTKNRRRST